MAVPAVITRLNAALEGRYSIGRELGEGGMATVYLADDIKHERKVALKVLKPELAAVVGAERFLAEIKTTANLQHPHILPLFDSGEADGFLYYVMPHVEGESLAEKLARERQLGVDEAVRIAKDAADALDYAHRKGIIHRDIKPANVLLHDGRPVVADFGIALAVSTAGGGRMTETGLSLGTPHYMSPEQASADRDLSARSDIYSLGCVLYEMLAGQPPHTGPSAQSVLVRILTEAPKPLTELRHTVPPHVSAVVAKAIEKLPADRFDTAKELREALDNTGFKYEPAVPGTAANRGLGWTRRARGTSGWLPWGVAALFGVFAAFGWLRPAPEEAERPPATRALVDIEGLPLDLLSNVVVSPDGRRLALYTSGGRESAIWVRGVEEEHFRRLTVDGNPASPGFSPDGNRLVYEDGGALKTIALSGGAARTVVPVDPRIGRARPSWGDDGRIVYDAEHGLFSVAESGGEPELLLEGSWDAPHALPDGRGVLIADRATATTYLLDLESDSVREVVPGGVAPAYVETGHLLYVDLQGGLWAAPFDLGRGEVTGTAAQILSGVTLTFRAHARYSVARNGTLVYGVGPPLVSASRGAPLGQLVVTTMDGDERTLPVPPGVIESPHWSPDGNRIVYNSTPAGSTDGPHMIYLYDVALGSAPRQLTFEGDNNSRPVWSPDGTRVAFNRSRDDGNGRDLHITNAYDDAPPRRIHGWAGRQSPTQWLEGDLLVFNSGYQPGQNDIWTMRLPDSATAAPYLAGQGDRVHAHVAHQGDLAAYVSDETGQHEVYVRSFPTPRQPTIVSTSGGTAPRWSPEGDKIYYWKVGDTGDDTLFVADVVREPAFAVRSTDFVLVGEYLARHWDLHPDGDRLIVVRAVASAEGEEAEPEQRHWIVTNWFTELLAALGEGN